MCFVRDEGRQFPDISYAVSNGGNHRALLAKQLNLKLIPAYVDVLIPEIALSEEFKNKYYNISIVVKSLLGQLRKLQGVPYNQEKEKLLKKLNLIDESIQCLLQDEAIRYKLITSD